MNSSKNFPSPRIPPARTTTFSSVTNSNVSAARDGRTMPLIMQPPPPPPPYPPPSKRDLSSKRSRPGAKEESSHADDVGNGTVAIGAVHSQNDTAAPISSNIPGYTESNPGRSNERTSSLPIINPFRLFRDIAVSKNKNGVNDKFDRSIISSAYKSMDGDSHSAWMSNASEWEGRYNSGHLPHQSALGTRVSAVPAAGGSISHGAPFPSQGGGHLDDEATVSTFGDGDWTPQDSAYGAAIPICGWIPKQTRRTIEMSLIGILILCFVYLIVTTSIRLTIDSQNGSGSGSNNLVTNDDHYVSYVPSDDNALFTDKNDEQQSNTTDYGNDGEKSSGYAFVDDDFYAVHDDDD